MKELNKIINLYSFDHALCDHVLNSFFLIDVRDENNSHFLLT